MDQPLIEVILRAVIVRDERILLCLNPATDRYYLPGGHLEFGETFAQCLRRELREEIGRDVATWHFRTVMENQYRRGGNTQHEVNIVFDVTLEGPGQESILSREPGVAYTWVPLEQFPRINLLPEPMHRSLREAFANGRAD